jgi:ribosomal protein S18 acetylase RimI-like enzyme
MTAPHASALVFRTATEADYPAVAAAIQAWWTLPGFDSEAAARERAALVPRLWLQHFASTSTVVEHEGALAGFLIGMRSQDRADEAFIHFVGVAPAFRRTGLGRRLYERFFVQRRAEGPRLVRCVTSPTNTASIAFHQAMGFTIGDTRPDYDGPGLARVTFARAI